MTRFVSTRLGSIAPMNSDFAAGSLTLLAFVVLGAFVIRG